MNEHGPNEERTRSDGPLFSRRVALTSGLAVSTAAGGFVLGRGTASEYENSEEASQADARDNSEERLTHLSPHGTMQQGITTPHPRQAHLIALVCDTTAHSGSADLLDRLGETITALTEGEHLNGLDPAGLTITVGIGPQIVAATLGDDALGAEGLPPFARENMSDEHRGGDLLLQICSDEPASVALAGAEILHQFASEVTLRWQVQGFRGRPDQGVGRNLLGFHDGLVVPRTQPELEADVWVGSPHHLTGATFAVVRAMAIDVRDFSSMKVSEQERSIGRDRDSGRPLSGGTVDDDIDLHAKRPSGEYAIDLAAHARRAHPMPAGASGLMLRRSYSFHNAPDDQGIIFVSFQNDPNTFIKTQHRLDEGDALLDHATTTFSGSFLVLPGYDLNRPLGQPLR